MTAPSVAYVSAVQEDIVRLRLADPSEAGSSRTR